MTDEGGRHMIKIVISCADYLGSGAPPWCLRIAASDNQRPKSHQGLFSALLNQWVQRFIFHSFVSAMHAESPRLTQFKYSALEVRRAKGH